MHSFGQDAIVPDFAPPDLQSGDLDLPAQSQLSTWMQVVRFDQFNLVSDSQVLITNRAACYQI